MRPELIVFKEKPVFARIIKEQGASTVSAFIKARRYAGTRIPKARRKEFLGITKKLLTRTLGLPIASSVVKQLAVRPIVSTAAHHDTATHPFFAHMILMEALARPATKQKNIISFSCGGISMNNSSFPRGLLFRDELGVLERTLFVSLKHHLHPVHEHQGYDQTALLHAYSKIEQLKLSAGRKKILRRLIEKSFGAKATLRLPLYSEQITRGVFNFWKQIPELKEHNVIYLEQETLARELIAAYHLKKATLINKILFDTQTRDEYLSQFDGIQGAFNRKEQRGTELFWGLTKENRVPLRIINNELINADYTLRIPLTPQSMTQALRQRALMPSMALTFTVLSFYYGIACGGGFSQVNYLTDMKAAYLRFLKNIKARQSELAYVSSIPTDFFTGEIVAATLKTAQGVVPATAVDLLIYRTSKTAKQLSALAKTLSLKDSIAPMMPELYKIITGAYPKVQEPITIAPCLDTAPHE